MSTDIWFEIFYSVVFKYMIYRHERFWKQLPYDLACMLIFAV